MQARELTQMRRGVHRGSGAGRPMPRSSALFAEALRLAGATQFVARHGHGRACSGPCSSAPGPPEPWKAAVLDAYHGSDFVALDRLCDVAMGRAVEGEAVDAGAAAPAYTEAIRAARAHPGRPGRHRRGARARGCRSGAWPTWTTSSATYDLLGEAGLARLRARRLLGGELLRLLHGPRLRGLLALSGLASGLRRPLRPHDRRLRGRSSRRGLRLLAGAGHGRRLCRRWTPRARRRAARCASPSPRAP